MSGVEADAAAGAARSRRPQVRRRGASRSGAGRLPRPPPVDLDRPGPRDRGGRPPADRPAAAVQRVRHAEGLRRRLRRRGRLRPARDRPERRRRLRRACSTWATRRSSRSAPTRTPTAPRRSPACDIPFWPMLLVGAIVAAMFGVLLGAPTLRLRGDYLAIVTLGFGEIVPVVFLNSDTYTNGTNGIVGPRPAEPLRALRDQRVRVHQPVAVLRDGRRRSSPSRSSSCTGSRIRGIGRAWVAIREDELAAASMGINTVTTKLLAFAIGASTSGLAGVFYASKLVDRQPRPVRLHGLVHRPRDGRARRHGQHLGRRRRARSSSTRSRARASSSSARSSSRCTSRRSPSGPSASTSGRSTSSTSSTCSTASRSSLMMLLRPEGLFPSRRRQVASCTRRRTKRPSPTRSWSRHDAPTAAGPDPRRRRA